MRSRSLLLIPAFALSFAAMDALAESWPAKPLHAIVPFAAGSSTDIVPRVVFEQLSQQLGLLGESADGTEDAATMPEQLLAFAS